MPLTTWSGLDVTKKEYRSSSLQVCAKASKSKNSPMGVCIDKSSRVWFNDWWQLTPQRLRRYSWKSQSCTVGRASKEGVSEATAAKWRFLHAVREAIITQLIRRTKTILIPRYLGVSQPILELRVLPLSPVQMTSHTTRCSPFGRTGYLPSRISSFVPLHMLPILLLSRGAPPPQNNGCHFFVRKNSNPKGCLYPLSSLGMLFKYNWTDHYHDKILN